jgi:hypothetical protein
LTLYKTLEECQIACDKKNLKVTLDKTDKQWYNIIEKRTKW